MLLQLNRSPKMFKCLVGESLMDSLLMDNTSIALGNVVFLSYINTKISKLFKGTGVYTYNCTYTFAYRSPMILCK